MEKSQARACPGQLSQELSNRGVESSPRDSLRQAHYLACADRCISHPTHSYPVGRVSPGLDREVEKESSQSPSITATRVHPEERNGVAHGPPTTEAWQRLRVFTSLLQLWHSHLPLLGTGSWGHTV